MSIKNYNPTIQNIEDLAKAIEYSHTTNQLESYSHFNTTGNIMSSMNTSISSSTGTLYFQVATSPSVTINPLGGTQPALEVKGDMNLTQPSSYIKFYTNMMKAVYSSELEKSQEFCMPTTKSKIFLGTLINHLNEDDAERILRLLFYSLKDDTNKELPSKHITTAIIEYAMKENI